CHHYEPSYQNYLLPVSTLPPMAAPASAPASASAPAPQQVVWAHQQTGPWPSQLLVTSPEVAPVGFSMQAELEQVIVPPSPPPPSHQTPYGQQQPFWNPASMS
ncbi:hypothetical protein BX616_007036, partial [Lobosporangium transversale]